MRRVYFLCFLILTVVVMDILLFHTRPSIAQQQSGFRVDRVDFFGPRAMSGSAPVFGTIVGFDCVQACTDGPISCFVASKIN
jgi:hypothetical protein